MPGMGNGQDGGQQATGEPGLSLARRCTTQLAHRLRATKPHYVPISFVPVFWAGFMRESKQAHGTAGGGRCGNRLQS